MFELVSEYTPTGDQPAAIDALSAAIEAGVHYASICDDWSAAQAVMAELDEPARAAGRIVLTGLGASPGVTNVGIRHLAGRLDRIRRVDVNVYQPPTARGGRAWPTQLL